MVEAISDAAVSPFEASAPKSASRARVTASRVSADRSGVEGKGRPSASAKPSGVGNANRAGWVKAKSSRTSKAGNGEVPMRRAVDLA